MKILSSPKSGIFSRAVLMTAMMAMAPLAVGRAHAEDVTLMNDSVVGEESSSETITLYKGDSARLVYCSGGFGGRLSIALPTKTFTEYCFVNENNTSKTNPVVIAGPATVILKSGGPSATPTSGFVTLSVTRVGITGSPASIPQEVDSKWNVILESSSDLENWLPVNPGEYTGSETRRFFRTRIVKKED